jgi:putative component of membrane protein insertase Oxa1/YidC/SpoIIIJ protein YidD
VLWRCYRLVVYPFLHALSGGGTVASCRHEPSCSVYALKVIHRLGWIRGFGLALRRVFGCNPWFSS